jgi:hypothetical protein
LAFRFGKQGLQEAWQKFNAVPEEEWQEIEELPRCRPCQPIRTFTLVAATALLALLACGSSAARSSSQYVSITAASQIGGHAQVTWTLAPGWCSNVIAIAKSPTTGSDGSFFTENLVDGGVLEPNQTSFVSSNAALVPWESLYEPRSYWVRVQAFACDYSNSPEWSDSATIVVPPLASNAPVVLSAKNVSLEIKTHDTFDDVHRVRVGQTLDVAAYAQVPAAQYFDFVKKAQICITRNARPALCRLVGNATGTPAPYGTGEFWKIRISPAMIIRNKFSIFVAYEGQTITRRTFPVVPKRR